MHKHLTAALLLGIAAGLSTPAARAEIVIGVSFSQTGPAAASPSAQRVLPAILSAMSSKSAKGNWSGKVYQGPLTHGRVYSEQEIWDNYTYFINRASPVAEDAGVLIAMHPDDPPLPRIAGVPRCIFSSCLTVQGAVHVVGSVIVAAYSMVFASSRVKRSTSVRFSPAPRYGNFGEKFVVSTTSVWPSKRPRESPWRRCTFFGGWLPLR